MKALLILWSFLALASEAHAQISVSLHSRVGGILDEAYSTECGLQYSLPTGSYVAMRLASIRYTAFLSGAPVQKRALPVLGVGSIYRITRWVSLGGEVHVRFNDPASANLGIGPIGLVGFIPFQLSPGWRLEVSTGLPYLLGAGLVYELP
jgi:hypothetical protein